jgi:hypothetical protein
MNDREAAWAYVGFLVGIVAMWWIMRPSRSESFLEPPYACKAHQYHAEWHAREDTFKLGQKNPSATSTAEVMASAHGR